jgi:UDP-GlcNAc:undecaprenyl-phosphate GlcNAc-1-phosphate transferase
VSGAAVLAALTAGAALGFLVHNFHPASVFMGDAGANLLGYLLGVVAVVGTLKTNAVVALLVPFVILAVPVLDTTFVVAKRLKYGRKPWSADANHFHHRMARIGFSQRKTVAYLYTWSALLALLAVALRVLPVHPHNTHYSDAWFAVLVALALVAFAFSVYLVVVLEIFKFPGQGRLEPSGSGPPYGGPGSGAPPPEAPAPSLVDDGSPAPPDGIEARHPDRRGRDAPAEDIETGEFTRVR